MNPKKKWVSKKPWVRFLYAARVRCKNPKAKNYRYYGGRGIKCSLTPEDLKTMWFRDKAFDMESPTVDRVDNDGNYVFENCRFLEREDNNRDRVVRKSLIDRRPILRELNKCYDCISVPLPGRTTCQKHTIKKRRASLKSYYTTTKIRQLQNLVEKLNSELNSLKEKLKERINNA